MHRAPLALIVLVLAVGALAGGDAPDAPRSFDGSEAPARIGPEVGYLPIDGEIDELKARFFKRALAQARADRVGTLVVHITSDGGHLFAGRDILTQALAVPEDGPRLVAFVDDRAISAAAMIAYGHHRILMSPNAGIGDIGVITIDSEGKMEYAPEKIETVVRGLLRLAAERRGWDKAKIEKMTARNQELWRIDVDGKPVFVLEHDLPAWQHDHPQVDPASKILVKPKDSLLYYTAREAVDEHMATELVPDLAAVYAQLGVTADQVRSYAPTGIERVSWLIAGWAPILLSLGILFVVLELKAPGIGIFTALAVLCFSAFFVCQYYQELAGNLEIVLVVVGGLAILADILVLPTGGILALLGFAAVLAGALLAFMPDDLQFHPSAEGFGDAAAIALTNAAVALAVTTAGLAALIWLLPRSAAVALLSANAEIGGTSATAAETAQALVGRRAVARTDLRPSGFIAIDGQDLSAVSEHGEHVVAGTAVEVVAMRFGEAIVRATGAAA